MEGMFSSRSRSQERSRLSRITILIGWLTGKIFADPTTEWGVDSFALWSLNDQAAYTYAVSQGIGSQVSSLLSAAYAHKNVASDLTVYTSGFHGTLARNFCRLRHRHRSLRHGYSTRDRRRTLLGIGTWRKRQFAVQ